MKRERIVDFDGIPHNADTGEPLPGGAVEPRTHWIDELPATSLEGIKLVTSPNDMVMRPDGVWMKRWEYEVWLFEEASDELEAMSLSVEEAQREAWPCDVTCPDKLGLIAAVQTALEVA